MKAAQKRSVDSTAGATLEIEPSCGGHLGRGPSALSSYNWLLRLPTELPAGDIAIVIKATSLQDTNSP